MVLVDADLPDATGFEICAELKSRGRTGTPSVLIRAPSVLDPDLHARVAACGADGVVRRGADPLELATAVRGLLRAHAAEQKARRIEEEALRRDALHQEMLAIAGHDLRTPLQVSLLATAALNRLDLPPQTRPHLDRIERSTHRAVRLVNDLLDVSIAQQGGIPIRPVWMDLGEVVRETARAYARLGDADNAFAWLARALELGYDKLDYLSADPDLASLRKDPRFTKLLDERRAGR